MDIKPSVLGIGYGKAATTYLSAVLASHPEIAFSWRKETHFFKDAARDEESTAAAAESYATFWPQYDPDIHRFAMEWTVSYINHESALDRIARFFADRDPPLFLLATRNPMRSVLSSYFYRRMINNDSPAARRTPLAARLLRPTP